jgi:hypothetical protein
MVADVEVKNSKIQDMNAQEMGSNNEEKIKLRKIQINSNLRDLDRNFIQRELMDLVKKYEPIFNDSIIEVFIRPQFIGSPNQRIIYTRILVMTSQGKFDITAEHRNIKLSICKALYRLEHQLSIKKTSIACGPKKFPYNFNVNRSYKGLSL